MRLRFGELSAAELRRRQQIVERGRLGWSCLATGDAQRARDTFSEIDRRIQLVIEGDSSVYLTALEPSAWPLARLLLCQAPRDLRHALSLGRAAQPLARALAEVSSRRGVQLSRASLRAGFSRGHLLEITLGVPGGNGLEIERIAAEDLVSAVLGERLFETWIGAVHVSPAPRAGSLRVLDVHSPRRELELSELFDTVAAAARGVLRGLPATARAESSERAELASSAQSDWTLLEVEPLASARGQRKDDLLLASTCAPELLRCFLDGSPCSSVRFSRAGEQFVFLSYADDERDARKRVARRSSIEAALDRSLGELGTVIGVGLGLHTSYVDFALCDLEAGLECLIAKSKELGLPPRTFIQFFDTELCEEWLSISPDSRLTRG